MPNRKRKNDDGTNEDGTKERMKYQGVVKIGERFRASIWIDGGTKCIGTFDTPKEAAQAFDRAAIQAGRPTSKLNFLDQVPKNYKPKKKKLRSTNTTGYRGVYKVRNRFRAAINIGGRNKRNRSIGYFGTTKEAAIAFDLAAIQAKRPTSDLNFPDMIHEVKKKISRRNKRRKIQFSNETSFHGVSKIGKKFRASVFLAGKIKHLGSFTRARDAAMAYDMAIVELSGKSMEELNSLLNFPNGMEEEVVEEEL